MVGDAHPTSSVNFWFLVFSIIGIIYQIGSDFTSVAREEPLPTLELVVFFIAAETFRHRVLGLVFDEFGFDGFGQINAGSLSQV
jgi:hypothetical protein